MCGILGYIASKTNGFNQNEVKAVHDMLHVTSLRGMDSTGVFYLTNQGDVQIHKSIDNSIEFLKTKEWETTDKELFRKGQAVVGHCRASTRGAKKDENAHPFIVDNKIILVHNGTVTGSHDHIAKTEVDSHAIAHALSEEPDVARALSRVNGAYALVWFNTETRKLYAIRNKERPLFMALMQDGSMMFASEESFIYTACWRNGMKIQQGYPELLKEHTLFSSDMDNIKSAYEWEELNCTYKELVKTPFPYKGNNVLALPVPRLKNLNSKIVPSLAEIAEQKGLFQIDPINDGYKKQVWRTWTKTGASLIIEATDYETIDEKNGLYYIFGKIVSANKHLNDFGAGWEIICPSEEACLQYVSKQFFEGNVELGLSRGYAVKPGEKETALFKFCDVEPATFAPVDTLERILN